MDHASQVRDIAAQLVGIASWLRDEEAERVEPDCRIGPHLGSSANRGPTETSQTTLFNAPAAYCAQKFLYQGYKCCARKA
jgi:hypothetical protein